MGIDTRKSRRTHYERCSYYTNQYTKQEVAEKVAEPKGIFYAMEVGQVNVGKDEWQNAIRRDRSSLTLTTNDEVDILVDDWVYFEGSVYVVESVSYEKDPRNHAISDRSSKTYFIGIRK